MNKKLSVTLTALMAVVLVVPVSPANAAPSVTTGPAILSSQHLVSVYGTVNPNGVPTEVLVEYGTTNSLGELKSGGFINGTRNQDITVPVWVDPGFTYYYRVIARSGGSISQGSIRTFSTIGNSNTGSTGSSTNTNTGSTGSSNGSFGGSNTGTNTGSQTSPTVLTNGPASVTATSVVANGTVNPNGSATSFWFEFGTTPSLGQSTTTQSLGSGYSNQLVSGSITGLAPNKTYYYRAVAQNSYGISRGSVVGFSTPAGSFQQSSGQAGQTGSGQVLGVATTGTNGTNGTSTTSGSGSNTSGSQTGSQSSTTTVQGTNVSLEYSLSNSNALVLVADEIKPRPGDQFTYTVSYKNNTSYYYNDARLKVIVPSEVEYIGADREPVNIEGSIIEFKLGPIAPSSQGTVSVITRIRDNVKPGTNLIFTSVLVYKNNLGEQEAVTSYMTVKVANGGGTPLAASVLGAIFSSSGMLWALALIIFIVVAGMIYSVIRIKNGSRKKNKKEDEFDLSSVPSTFEPIKADGPFKR